MYRIDAEKTDETANILVRNDLNLLGSGFGKPWMFASAPLVILKIEKLEGVLSAGL